MAARRNNNRYTIRKNGRGYTLVEMIVVLTVIAILATGGFFTSIGYVKRAEFNQNESNAETIFHAVQSGLQQMEKSGKISSWVEGSLISKGTQFAYKNENQSSNISLESKFSQEKLKEFNDAYSDNTLKPNTSVHMRYILTYNPQHSSSDQSVLLKNLIQPFFYDASIFSGTITVEFDVEKGVDSYKTLHYAAKCLSVFVDSRSKNGWDDDAYINKIETDVPTRAFAFRRTNSHIGYYDGYSGTSVDTVYLPKLQEGIVLNKFTAEYLTQTETEVDGENTVEVEKTHTWLTFSATLDKNALMGADKDVYYRISLRNGDETKHLLILNDDFMVNGQNLTIKNNNNLLALKDKDNDDDIEINGNTVKVAVDHSTVVYTDTVSTIVTKKSISFIAQVFIKSTESDGYKNMNKADIEEKLRLIPMKITYVTGELDSNLKSKDGYYEYSLDISRAVDKYDNPIELLKDVNKAVMTIHPNYFNSDTDMTGINDKEGIIALKKSKSTHIEQVTDPEPTP